jgi:aspartyl-tRNA(Asn)/glutamyl-tRNA(Gln) amidotransferase subunit A
VEASPSRTAAAYAVARAHLERYQPAANVPLGVTAVPLGRRRADGSCPLPEDPAAYGTGPLVDAARALRAGETTALELVRRSLAAIERWTPPTNAIVHVAADEALAHATWLDLEAAHGRWHGLLHGIPLTVKDNIHVAGMPTRAGSAAYLAHPSVDAAAVALARAAGAVVLAKVTTHEFALGVTTPQARHPRDPLRIAGGSSGGSAISVDTGMALASLGTDTRASIRVPASLCGVVGLKPTFGCVPAEGIVWLSWTIDTVGVLAGATSDVACVADVLSSGVLGLHAAGAAVRGMRLGVPRDAFEDCEPEVVAAVQRELERLAALGVALVDVVHPRRDEFDLANAAGLIVSRCEALEYHRSLGTVWSELWPETRDQLEATTQLGMVDYLRAQRFRADLAMRMLAEVESAEIDGLAMPTTLVQAPLLARAEDYFTRLSKLAIPWSIMGWPVLSVPAHVGTDELPVGLQLVAPPFEDATLVRLGRALEAEASAAD